MSNAQNGKFLTAMDRAVIESALAILKRTQAVAEKIGNPFAEANRLLNVDAMVAARTLEQFQNTVVWAEKEAKEGRA